ncbi:hypothetical protein JHL16_25035 [Aestuariivirga sp. YIM B02566]|jgi:hypothetical protein|uniref:Uncharacterized protein n=1 Tax=Taklimakanibacter albus TaxID=2800327 RepID=A0ACC5RAZ9_9HYPH|nr:hypothetical protein [Aestuariivirga sp. YIM B02566]
MRRCESDHDIIRERALGDGLSEVATELRLVDVTDLIAYIRGEQLANLGDIVSSSIERFFKPDTLRYGKAADIDLSWGSEPAIKIDMEFHNQDVSVYFSLLLESLRAGVEINYTNLNDAAGDPSRNTARLIKAIADARLMAYRPA